ncbi:cytochrome P450 90D2-like [Gastrolobium bilobum]|uniref:cytochrome P450 90D2-like n=1 Tax=Gastrolobium bilobum TaxID=150636 RepID=UPI002AB06052|nr:cytochrome P450 90D2-like [Gastrolobium bilobum]
MDNIWIVFVTTFLLFTVIMVVYRNRRIRLKPKHINKLPLGTLGWPFIGETIEFVSCAYSDRPESFMDKRCRMYGKVFKSHIFGSPTIVSTDADVNKFILQSDAKVFVPSYPKSLTELMGESSILLINGSLQKRIHGLIGAFFKSQQLKAQITRDMQKYVQESMANWREDHLIYVQDETKNIAFQVLVKALISLDPGEEMELLKKQFQEFISGLMSLPIKLPGTKLYQSLQAKKKMVKLVQKTIQTKRNSGISKVPKDAVDVLLNDANEQLTDDLIADNMIDMMIPGEDSVPVLMTLAIKYLSECPAALQQLMEENVKLKKLKDQLGESLCWSDYLSLPYTQMVITETLRMGNIIIGVMRKAMKDVEIKGYLIPKGWCVFAYFRSVHLDNKNFDWPYQFNPWRWQDKDMSSFNFTPFGGGQRLCPGLDLARLEASIFLHHFVTQFRWQAEEDTIVNFPTVRMKRRMPILVRRRSNVEGGEIICGQLEDISIMDYAIGLHLVTLRTRRTRALIQLLELGSLNSTKKPFAKVSQQDLDLGNITSA